MRIILSAAMSIDGYLDDRRPERLLLSSPEDLAAIQDLRDGCDAILVGAETIRRDNPSLSPRDEAQRRRRRERDLAAEPIKVTMTRSGNLPANAKFFLDGEGVKLVYIPSGFVAPSIEHAEIRHANNLAEVVRDLEGDGCNRLLVEGGTQILTGFLTEGLVDELRLAVAPIFVGDAAAPRLVNAGIFPDGRMVLEDVRAFGDTAVLTYSLERRTA